MDATGTSPQRSQSSRPRWWLLLLAKATLGLGACVAEGEAWKWLADEAERSEGSSRGRFICPWSPASQSVPAEEPAPACRSG